MTTNKVSSESPFYFQLIHVNTIWNIKIVFMQNGYRLQWYGIFPPFLIRYLAQLGLLLKFQCKFSEDIRCLKIKGNSSEDARFRPLVKSVQSKLLFLLFNQNICCGYSKELSQ